MKTGVLRAAWPLSFCEQYCHWLSYGRRARAPHASWLLSLSEVQCIVGLLPEGAHPLAMGPIHHSGRKAWAGPGLS